MYVNATGRFVHWVNFSKQNNPNAHDDRNNTPDIEDSDEFFDAEDVYVDDFTAVQGFEASSEGRG